MKNESPLPSTLPGTRNPFQSLEALDAAPGASFVFKSCESRVTMDTLFAGGGPLEIEIGCGKGNFLIARAQDHPEIRFLGIDRLAKWMKAGAKRGEKRGLENLHFIKAEARQVLRDHVALESVSAFYIYFPDPWPKRRHRPRRLVNAGLLALLYSRLREGGQVQIATDDPDYFKAIRESVGESGVFWRAVSESINARPGETLVKTSYELRFEAQNKTLYYLELLK